MKNFDQNSSKTTYMYVQQYMVTKVKEIFFIKIVIIQIRLTKLQKKIVIII